MSNLDLLSTKEAAHAASQNWMLCWVAEGDKFSPQILPLDFDHVMPNAEAARRYVSSLAMNGSAVAMKALAIVVQDAMPKRMAKRKKAKA